MKRCTKCGRPEGVVRFTKNKNNRDGKEFRCVGCRREDYLMYYRDARWRILAGKRVDRMRAKRV